MDRLKGKVALVTGAARGQGRSHAIRFAEEGADVIVIDACQDSELVAYPLATKEDFEQTVSSIESLGRRVVAHQLDVVDAAGMKAAIDASVRDLGRLDVVCANAGISTAQPFDQVTPVLWERMIGTNLTGVWNTLAYAAPHVIASGGGSMMATGSTASVKGLPFFGPYVAAKFGVVGIVKSLANELAPYGVRVNVIHPTGVYTPMREGLFNSGIGELIRVKDSYGPLFMNSLPVEALDVSDITNAVMFLASDESRYVTGLELSVDAGNTIR